MEENSHGFSTGSRLRGHSEVSAALLFAVVVELALPVHHVGGPAVELHFPLTLSLVDVVWNKHKERQDGCLRSSLPFFLNLLQVNMVKGIN